MRIAEKLFAAFFLICWLASLYFAKQNEVQLKNRCRNTYKAAYAAGAKRTYDRFLIGQSITFDTIMVELKIDSTNYFK